MLPQASLRGRALHACTVSLPRTYSNPAHLSYGYLRAQGHRRFSPRTPPAAVQGPPKPENVRKYSTYRHTYQAHSSYYHGPHLAQPVTLSPERAPAARTAVRRVLHLPSGASISSTWKRARHGLWGLRAHLAPDRVPFLACQSKVRDSFASLLLRSASGPGDVGTPRTAHHGQCTADITPLPSDFDGPQATNEILGTHLRFI